VKIGNIIRPQLAAGHDSVADQQQAGTSIAERHGDSWRGRATALVVQTPHGLLDVAAAADWTGIAVPTTMASLMESGESGRTALAAVVAAAVGQHEHPSATATTAAATTTGTTASKASGSASGLFLDEAEVEWAPAVIRPEKIIGVGLNYRLHAEEMGDATPTRPVLFSKFNNGLTGHRSEVPIPVDSENLDYEAELAIVIGRDTYRVSEADALSYVFGYTTANDVSARDLQYATSQWMLGKISDNCAPLGPLVATVDEIPDPNALAISCERNEVVVQSAHTSDMVFSCRQLVSYISRFLTLRAGDIILTGTPPGVIKGRLEAEQVWLQPGDTIVTRIENIGTLHYSVAAPRP